MCVCVCVCAADSHTAAAAAVTAAHLQRSTDYTSPIGKKPSLGSPGGLNSPIGAKSPHTGTHTPAHDPHTCHTVISHPGLVRYTVDVGTWILLVHGYCWYMDIVGTWISSTGVHCQTCVCMCVRVCVPLGIMAARKAGGPGSLTPPLGSPGALPPLSPKLAPNNSDCGIEYERSSAPVMRSPGANGTLCDTADHTTLHTMQPIMGARLGACNVHRSSAPVLRLPGANGTR